MDGEPIVVEVTAEHIANSRKNRYCAAELALVEHFGQHVEASYDHASVYTNIPVKTQGFFEGADFGTFDRYAMNPEASASIKAVDLNHGRSDADREVVEPFSITLTKVTEFRSRLLGPETAVTFGSVADGDVPGYPFATGQDAPPEGAETFGIADDEPTA